MSSLRSRMGSTLRSALATLPIFRVLVGLVLLVCSSIFYLFPVPTTYFPFAEYRQINHVGGPNHAGGDQSRYPPFGDAFLPTQRQINALLYGAGICTMVSLAALVDLLLLQQDPPSPSSPSDPPNRQRLGKRRQAVVILGTTAALLTIHPPTDSPSRAAALVALVCAGASLMASGITVVRLWRVSASTPTHHLGTAGSFFSESPIAPSPTPVP